MTEPVPVPPDFRALCAELVKAVDDASNAVDLISDCLNPNDFADQIKESCELIGKHDDLLIRAGAALAAESQGPTDEELRELAASINVKVDCGSTSDSDLTIAITLRKDLAAWNPAFARAVLARWGSATPRPIPFAERSPEPEDCLVDEESDKCCWYFLPETEDVLGGWILIDIETALLRESKFTHWLPWYALPLPA